MPFTLDIFEDPNLPYPLPIVDITEGARWWQLSLLKLYAQSYRLNLYYYLFKALIYALRFCAWLTQMLAWVLLRKDVKISSFNYRRGILKFTLHVMCHSKSEKIHRFWWQQYFYLSDINDFQSNYIEAWGQRGQRRIHIFVESDHLQVPIPDNADDAMTLKHLRMWYKWMLVKRSLSEILLPKALERVDRVHMRKYPLVLGDRVETLELGRSGRRLVNLLEDPEQVAGQFEVTRKILKNIDTEGVEFVRGWDKAAISVVVLTPFFMSLVFVGVWVGVFVHQGKDPQAVVQTAFTVASYIVTVGALIIALVAFLDSRQ